MSTDCHCGKDGHPLNSINCPVHGTGGRSVDELVREVERYNGMHQIACLEIERLREALIEARIFIVNYSDRRYAARAFETLAKIGQVIPDEPR